MCDWGTSVYNAQFEDYQRQLNQYTKQISDYARRAKMSGDEFKFDGGKPRWDLVPLNCIEEVAKVMTHGCEKYEEENWKQIPEPRKRYYSAMMRHMTKWKGGETIDSDSGLPHISHALTCLVFLTWFDIQEGRT